MKIKPLIIALSGIALAGTVCTSAFFSYAQTESTVQAEEISTSDYEEILAPYQKVFDEFNSTHDTTYGFMTEEQLASHNMNREEYLKEMVNIYGSMTTEEFENFLETAYNNDKGYYAENLPYYETEENVEEVVVESGTMDENGNFYLLDND